MLEVLQCILAHLQEFASRGLCPVQENGRVMMDCNTLGDAVRSRSG